MRYREMRLPCDCDVRLDTSRGPVRATLRNVCSVGGRVTGVSLPLGEEIALRSGSDAIGARVRWVRGGACGLRFLREIDPEELLRLRGKTPGPAAPSHHRYRSL
ncbi:PilZ domain-containing protein [Pelagovum pacificum]|uniref:PilZ domain-containing protein n=1 Tax=Pelagovum pacificum TaxID=2588711 RepID=A0A5C5GGL9_9RHOB|nr:PilZ domain-containing protein [Pelagovum pacificum]QQA43710.1 hypothetical protein I8N54_03800 [Pelagovum pacificum]TNY33159.1 hypothetical protein FHY64_07735 [Pelagovum pacificum]